MIYVASPYSHPRQYVREDRYHAVCRAVVKMIQDGLVVFSPIIHSHVLHDTYGLGGDWSFWQRIDEHMIDLCEKVVVLKLPGWEESKGIAAEVAYAERVGKVVEWVEPERIGT